MIQNSPRKVRFPAPFFRVPLALAIRLTLPSGWGPETSRSPEDVHL